MSEVLTIELPVDDVVWRQDLYPRFEPVPSRIQQYAEVLDLLPPIEVNQRNELIDGYHRWIAHKKAEKATIKATVTETGSDADLDRLMARRNAAFGVQLTQDEKERKAKQWYTDLTVSKEGIAQDLGVTVRTVQEWLSRKTKDMKAERDRQIAQMWLACYTEDEIAGTVGTSVQPVKASVEKPDENEHFRKHLIFSRYEEPDWKPPLYDVWKVQDKSNKVGHFGNTEATWVDYLVYLYTRPFDIVVDPFAGGGSTIDVCKHRLRRYWVSDRTPIVERLDIRKHDILDGVPNLHKRWGDVRLLYLDPPYWWQAKGEYSDDPADLANMDLGTFYRTLTGFVKECAKRMPGGSHIALIIQPTQWRAPDRKVVDHILDLALMLDEVPLRYVRRIQCPYESQQATAQMVEWAKKNREILVLSREIIVWEVSRE